MASPFSPANLAFTYLQSGLCPPCHLPPVFAEVHASILQILIEFSALAMQQEPGQSSHSQHPYLQRDHLDIKPSDLIPDPHLSLPVVLNALSHLLLYGAALWFSSHRYACLPASYSITFLVSVHGKCSQGLCLEPPDFFLRSTRCCSYLGSESETADPHNRWGAGDGGECWYQWLTRTRMRVVLKV